jgi:hypothetical protein
MSQPPQPNEGSASYFEVKFICTGKRERRHRKVTLQDFVVGPGDAVHELVPRLSFRPAERESMFGGASTYDEFFCTKCRRNPRLLHETFLAMIRQARQQNTTVIDISGLPF